MSQVSSAKDSNTTMYTTGGAVTGAAAIGAMGYYSKPWLQNGTLTDTFVQSVEKTLGNTAQDVITAKAKSGSMGNIYGYICGLTEKNFKNKKAIEKVHNKIVSILAKVGDTGNRQWLKNNLTSLSDAQKIAAYIQEKAKLSLIGDCFGADGKLIAEKTKDGVGAVVKKVANNMKLKKAGWYGLVGAALAGFLAWTFTSEQKDNDLQKLKKDILAA